MTNVEQLLRETLTGLADQGRIPSMGERALAGAGRRRRRQMIASGLITITVLAALTAASVLLGPGDRRSAGPIAPDRDQRVRIDLPGAVVDYYQDAMNVQQNWLLDPEIGRYRLVDQRIVSVSPDLRYAIVTGRGACGGQSERACNVYSRYDTATGKLEQLGIRAAQYECGEWSPDGSTVACYRLKGDQGVWYLAELLLVDFESGQQHSIPIHEEDGWLPNDLVGWTMDGQGLIVAGLGPARIDLAADLLYKLDGSVAAIHRWGTPGKTRRLMQVVGTNLIARMPLPAAARPVEIRDAVTGTLVATYSHEQMLATGMVEPGPEFTAWLSAWISDHEVVGQPGYNEVLLADLRTGTVRTVAEIPGDGGGIHVAHVD
ncbi:MAG TPA: hypothetical protein VHO00_03630 [Actinomycetes bacterium]|jgi:hypothetical protein|nr:hypothetical protein [Actinomycetes bacterium]